MMDCMKPPIGRGGGGGVGVGVEIQVLPVASHIPGVVGKEHTLQQI